MKNWPIDLQKRLSVRRCDWRIFPFLQRALMASELSYGPFISRKQAKEQGLKHYFTGKPCKHEHIATRLTSKGICTDCNRQHNQTLQAAGYHRSYYAKRMATDETFREAKRRDALNHYHNVMKHDSVRMASHYERSGEYQRQHRDAANKNRRSFRKRNPGYDRPYTVARRANIKHSALTVAEQKQVVAIYKLRKTISELTGIEHHVDHHKPLSKGGAHHPSNLWVIPAKDNLAKSGKWEGVAA